MHACTNNQALFATTCRFLALYNPVPHRLLTFPLATPRWCSSTVCCVPETHVYLVAAKATRVSVRLTPNGSCMTPSSIFIEMTTAPLVLLTHLSHGPRCSNLALSCLLHRSPQASPMLGLEAFSDTLKIAMTEILVSTCNTERLPTSYCLTTLGNRYSSLSEFRRSEFQTKARTPKHWCRNI